MEVLGFVFGISGITFGMIGMSMATNASAQVAMLEQRLIDAGLIADETESG